LYPMALFTDYHVPIHQSKMDWLNVGIGILRTLV
jgi:hypothetical protein